MEFNKEQGGLPATVMFSTYRSVSNRGALTKGNIFSWKMRSHDLGTFEKKNGIR